jgi:hypothetical protein
MGFVIPLVPIGSGDASEGDVHERGSVDVRVGELVCQDPQDAPWGLGGVCEDGDSVASRPRTERIVSRELSSRHVLAPEVSHGAPGVELDKDVSGDVL